MGPILLNFLKGLWYSGDKSSTKWSYFWHDRWNFYSRQIYWGARHPFFTRVLIRNFLLPMIHTGFSLSRPPLPSPHITTRHSLTLFHSPSECLCVCVMCVCFYIFFFTPGKNKPTARRHSIPRYTLKTHRPPTSSPCI